MVALIRQPRTDETALLKLLAEVEGPLEERKRHQVAVSQLCDRWKEVPPGPSSSCPRRLVECLPWLAVASLAPVGAK